MYNVYISEIVADTDRDWYVCICVVIMYVYVIYVCICVINMYMCYNHVTDMYVYVL